MKRVHFFLVILFLGSSIFAEAFEGFYGIKFGQAPEEVKKNIEKEGFTISELTDYDKNAELIFKKKQTKFYEIECNFLTVTAVFKNNKMDELLVFCENYSDDIEKLFSDVENTLSNLSKSYNFKLTSEEDYNTKSAFLKEYNDNKGTTLEICNNHEMILFDFKLVSSESIQWLKVTNWEYLGEDSDYSYLLDLYDDFADAKIDVKQLSHRKQSGYKFIDYFVDAECNVAKLQITSKKDNEDSTKIILYLENKVLYECELAK